MDFFEGLGKKISQAGQTAVQKTKDVTDIARISSAISDEEKKINNNYYEIGKLYVELHSSDYETYFANMVEAIKESAQKMSEYHRQIQDIKGVIRCEKCGAEVEKNAAFCSSCGAPMPKPVVVDENMMQCPDCGQMVSKDMRFCTSCGRPINETVFVQPPVNRCPNCGAEHAEGAVFCTECGAKMG